MTRSSGGNSPRCVVVVFSRLPNHRLETVARHLLGKLPEGLRLHRALDDAKVTAMMWMEMERKRS